MAFQESWAVDRVSELVYVHIHACCSLLATSSDHTLDVPVLLLTLGLGTVNLSSMTKDSQGSEEERTQILQLLMPASQLELYPGDCKSGDFPSVSAFDGKRWRYLSMAAITENIWEDKSLFLWES